MRLNKISNYILLLLLPLFVCCSSRSYDIEEVEEEVPEEQTKNTEPEIKKEIEPPADDSKIVETKEEVTKESNNSANYTIQIGAFYIEDNAIDLLEGAKDKFGLDIYYRFKDGFYKVAIGRFNSRSEALTILGKIQESGYSDAFITVFFK